MWYELAIGLRWYLFLPGAALILMGLFGDRFSPQFARSKRVLVSVGVLLIALSVLSLMAEGFVKGYQKGVEIRQGQGR